MAKKMHKYEGEEFEILKQDCSLEVRLIESKGTGVYGRVVSYANHQHPFSGMLVDANGEHISSQLASTVEQAINVACGYVLAYRPPNRDKACEDIAAFFDKL